mmetsp:Transcript_16984/g.53941  ORF Transcript_16984/g.53941 Transcript_16984/m.53941 type:complete len:344 (+) Transcript_16984:2614-3645(+)
MCACTLQFTPELVPWQYGEHQMSTCDTARASACDRSMVTSEWPTRPYTTWTVFAVGRPAALDSASFQSLSSISPPLFPSTRSAAANACAWLPCAFLALAGMARAAASASAPAHASLSASVRLMTRLMAVSAFWMRFRVRASSSSPDSSNLRSASTCSCSWRSSGVDSQARRLATSKRLASSLNFAHSSWATRSRFRVASRRLSRSTSSCSPWCSGDPWPLSCWALLMARRSSQWPLMSRKSAWSDCTFRSALATSAAPSGPASCSRRATSERRRSSSAREGAADGDGSRALPPSAPAAVARLAARAGPADELGDPGVRPPAARRTFRPARLARSRLYLRMSAS